MWAYRLKTLQNGSVVKETTINEFKNEEDAIKAIRKDYYSFCEMNDDSIKLKPMLPKKFVVFEREFEYIYTIHYFKSYCEF